MLIEITGFLADSSEDNSIKLKINVKPKFERTVMNLMGWKQLNIGHGDTPLTKRKAQQISAVINEEFQLIWIFTLEFGSATKRWPKGIETQ